MQTCFHVRIPKLCLAVHLSVRIQRKEISDHHRFVNISPTLVFDTSMERSSRVAATSWELKNLNFFQKSLKFEF